MNNNKSATARANRAITQIDEGDIAALVAQANPLWPDDLTPEQARTVAAIAIQYGLDPLAGELVPYQGKPYITVDGRLRKARESGKWRGIVEDRPATTEEYEALHVPPHDMLWFVSIKHADWLKPNGAYGRVKANADKNLVAKEHPAEVARTRALYRCLREAFGIPLPGVYDDENVAASGVDVGGASVNVLASQEQIGLIHQLRKDLELSEEEYRRELQQGHGVHSSKELTQFQAEDLINDWQERLAQKTRPRMSPEDKARIDDAFGWQEC